MSTHSILPLDHWTTGLPEEALRGLVERHHVRFELWPRKVVKGEEREVERRGWVVDLYGSRSTSDEGLPSGDAHHHLHDVLKALARAIVPEETGAIDIDLEPFTGAVRMSPKRKLDEEVRLRIEIAPETAARMSMLGDADTGFAQQIMERLAELGAEAR